MIGKVSLKNPFYLIGLSMVFGVVLSILLYGTLKLEKNVESKMIEISTSDVLDIVKNNAKHTQSLLNQEQNYITQIKESDSLQKVVEEHLKLLITKNIKYAYILYRDNNGVFRFLADASEPHEKAMMDQKFDVTSPLWAKMFKTKKPKNIHHEFLKELSITHLYPILQNNEVRLVLAVDFSIAKVKDINTIITIMKITILSTIIIVFFFLIILAIQTFRYITAKNSAYTDKLTKAYNRNYLQELQDFINLDDYALAAVDIDYFKKVNDTYGHDVGDIILRDIVSIIHKNTRKKEDIVIRYGGEEFVILSKLKRDDKKSPLNIFERIFQNIQKHPFYISKTEAINITVSMGINLTPGRSRTFSDAFKLADIALYNAKNKGRNSIEIYEQNQDLANSAHLSINEVNAALEEDRVFCYFQPIVNTKTKEVSHYEALLRVIDKGGNIVTPNIILPAIKGTFILRNITKRVLKICYKTLQKHPHIQISININPQDIINDTIIEHLKEYAKEENIAQRIGLEIVESEDIVHFNHASENILMLKKLGYKIFIDDFGTGYSNFVYLMQIKSDFIKIDGEIIKKILHDKVSLAVVKSIVNFTNEANISVVAEHVSSKEIYDIVAQLGIEYCQGYYFSAPKPLPE
jgi:diguanylate cyclase (GGDEF)-like protein